MTLDELQAKIGVTFKNSDLLQQAFIHRSHLNESKEYKESNERLEFLGDAVLSFITSQYLYTTYPKFPEGTLTNIRSTLVKTKSLGTVASELGLGTLLLLSRGEESSGGRVNESLLADSFEALLGAIFLDSGIDAARQFLIGHLLYKAETIIETKSYVDFKSLLQELTQEKTKASPIYRVTKSEGPDHNKTFWVEVGTGDTVLGSGIGKSKQEAEQYAAQNALEKSGDI
ncbi:MAG: ribonuclease III [Patescibacteria group bacterium]